LVLKKLFCLLALFTLVIGFGQVVKLPLDQGWKFSSMDNPKELLPAKVPGTIHTDLFENEMIPHPFVGDNEKDLQWISEKNWVYETQFELSKAQLENQNIHLVFEGLDTYAKVFLNGKLILEANNAFRTWKSDVKKLLKKKNKLQIEFTPTKIIEEQKKKEIPYELPEGNRIFTRKPQFQYGWDWGPKYNTMGIWRPVYLEFWDTVKIEDVYIQQLNLSEEKADLNFELSILDRMIGVRRIDILLNDEIIY